MSQLESLLDAFHRGEVGFEELGAAVDARLLEAPESGYELGILLDIARGQGLPEEIHQALVAKIGHHAAVTSATTTWGTSASEPGHATADGELHHSDTELGLRNIDPETQDDVASETEARAALTATGGFPVPPGDGSPELGEGDYLRGRFELISKLGEGGMGAVWKGKDLLKEEAKDRNPYVAIKLLQKNFKEHPDAFVALQRETAKQQRLAHPNVATVFSFDRDTNSGAVFMSMDLLEGESLDDFIKNIPEGGLGEEEAMSIIQQVAAGLAYAHKNALVHSDLKPGNCFLTHDGTVKLLDFGIARASKTKIDAEGVTTLFDPGELGAITPAYASVEMFEGKAPDPRDDIYALGIMAYQLLTGRHPYDKMSAPRARDQGLVPEPVAKLSKRQNRGLARALSLNRDTRTVSVDQFIDDMQRRHNLRMYGIAASVVAVMLIAALGYAQITDFVRGKENEAIISVLEHGGIESIAEGLSMIQALESDDQRRDVLKDSRTRDAIVTHIARGDQRSIREGLALIRPFDSEWQQHIREDPRARDIIISDYERKIDAAFNPANDRYDYGAANEYVKALGTLYPNSATVLTMGNELVQRREQELDRLTRAYESLLGDLHLPLESADEGIGGILQAIRLLDPEHPTLADPRLANAFIDQIRASIDNGDLNGAKSIIDSAKELIPGDPGLAQLNLQLAERLKHQRQDRLAMELRAHLEQERDSLNTLADFRGIQNELTALASQRPQDSMLKDLRWQLKQIFASEFDTLMVEQHWQQAEELLVEFARFFEISYVESQQGRLSTLQDAHGYRIPASAARRDALARRADVINRLLKKPLLTPKWEVEFETAFKESLAMVGTQGSGVQLIKKTMMRLYRDRAVEAVEARQYVQARNLTATGRAYGATPMFDDVDRMLVEAQQSVLTNQQSDGRETRVVAAKTALLAHAAAGRPEEAAQLLQTLRSKLPPDDPFITESAQPAVAGAYLASAGKSRAAGELDTAVQQLERAHKVSPTQEVEKALARYRDERAHRDLTASLSQALEKETRLDGVALSAGIAEHKQRYPDEHEALTAELVALATARLLLRTRGPPLDSARLREELDIVRSLFPQSVNSLKNEVSTAIEQRAASLAATDPYAAYDYRASALLVLPGNQALSELSAQLPPSEIAKVHNDIEAGRLIAARASLRMARARHPDHDEIAILARALDARTSEAVRAYESYVHGVRKRALSEASQRRAAYAGVQKLWSDNPDFHPVAYREPRAGECTEELAGRGREHDGICYDLIAGADRSVPMVVVPSGATVGKAFAIGKYETSIGEYNAFCELSGECKPLDDKDSQLPVTGVTRQAAERYAHWLSERASHSNGDRVVYRLPTDIEWHHAAGADGKRATRGINCRPSGKVDIESGLLAARDGSVSLGIPMGRGLVSVTFGEENGWGVVNPVGNAEEWVLTKEGLAARGGAYSDKASRCTVAFSRSHDGAADERTGFRLLRELD